MKKEQGWPHVLFVQNPHLYLPELLTMEDLADDEVEGICQIFNDFKIRKNGKILDFSCGIGRHSVRLASKGYEVVGYDPSTFFLDMARRRINDTQVQGQLRFYQGEPNYVSKILSENHERGFEAIIIMFNSLGYTSKDDDIITFRNLLSLASKEGCVLITQTENRDWRLKNFEPYIISDFGKLQVNEFWKFNLVSSTSEGNWKIYKKIRRNLGLELLLDLKLSQRLYSLHELKDTIELAGWKFVKGYGSIKLLQEVSPDTAEIITVSKCE
jgi:SAM-dependent methyltransferase